MVLAGGAKANAPPPQPLDLQLEVSINGRPTQQIGAFLLDTDNRLSATREELTALGIDVPGRGDPQERVILDAIPGLVYRYDDVKQAVAIDLPEGLRLTRSYDAGGQSDLVEPQSATGALINYSIYTEASHQFHESEAAINGGSLSLDARGFSRLGTISQSGLLGTTTFADLTALRLDTTWAYADEIHARSYRAGDIVSGALSWTRPIRMGGVQVQRNFALRPDLVTMPLPSVTGSAALPSTIDVYVNNVKTYSQQVEAGNYRIDNLPVITGSGSARVVVTDSSGRETEQESDFYASPNLLRRGLTDYSAEIGVARRDYGTSSFGYDDKPAAVAGLRYGITDWLTGELHGEAGLNLANAGLGAVIGTPAAGEISAAMAVSRSGNGIGALLFAGWDREFGPLSLSASTRRAFGNYDDLASVTATDDGLDDDFAIGLDARAVDQLSLSYGFPDYRASAGIGLVHVEDDEDGHSLIASGSVVKAFDNDMSVFASGFYDVGGDGGYGLFAGLSYSFGESLSGSAGFSADGGTARATATVSRAMDGSPGGYAWRLSRGAGDTAYTAAAGDYQGTMGLVHAEAYQEGSSASLNLAVDGAVVGADGGLFLSPRIDESFAVVDVGAADVPVRLENRMAGTTGSNGKLLVPGLRSYERNKLSIDVGSLPVNADIPRTETIVVPREKSGVTVDFEVKQSAGSAIVILTDSDGKYLAPGSEVSLDGRDEPFVVGFDGEVYLTGLGPRNTLRSVAHTVACTGEFVYGDSGETQQVIGPVKCS